MSKYFNAYKQSISDRVGFWKEQTSVIDWKTPPQKILENTEQGFYQWFPDGELNITYQCLDRHILQGKGEQTALIYDSPVSDVVQKFTYNELSKQVQSFAAGLQSLGVGYGDTIVIYMPMIPQAVIAMLACARIGAVHSVVFGGFAPHELAIRIDDIKPKVIISASHGIEFTNVIPYQPLVNQSLQESVHQPEYLVYFQRKPGLVTLNKKNEIDFNQLLLDKPCEAVAVKSNDPLYVLYTSGTTGKPKGIVRDHGGYATALAYSMKNFYGAKPGEVFWAASDVGWVVGHSYIVYAPLLYGCITVLYEGKPVRTPDAGAFWRVIEQHRVSIMFVAPTAIRAIKKEDSDGKLLEKYDVSSLKTLFLAGERCDVSTLNWISDKLKIPVIDHWWQTESGWPMLGVSMGLEQFPVRPGSAGKPVAGYEIDILTEEGEVLPAGKEGFVVIKLPLPPGCLTTLWNDFDGFKKSYLSHFEGYYQTGDGGYKDDDGYTYITGRIDDVINVSGHRLSTAEMEEIVASHEAVVECAVLGVSDELRGQRPVAFVVLKDGYKPQESMLEAELVQLVRQKIGAVAFFKTAIILKRLPKTRSGKILRKTIRKIADKESYVVPSTIDDPVILQEIEQECLRREI